jgi:hypothetical protein
MKKLSSHQQKLYDFCKESGGITTAEAIGLIGHHYYHNEAKHVGAVLTRMVAAKVFLRVRIGRYEVWKDAAQVEAKGVLSLFG